MAYFIYCYRLQIEPWQGWGDLRNKGSNFMILRLGEMSFVTTHGFNVVPKECMFGFIWLNKY